jgi:hypothetical protein
MFADELVKLAERPELGKGREDWKQLILWHIIWPISSMSAHHKFNHKQPIAD